MLIKTLRPFQDEAVASGVALFQAAKKMLDVADAGHDAAGRARVVNHNGYLLIEAPTGSGKTLMAGCVIERFSALENVVWFWFAPFKGVVSQAEAFLREQFQGLRLRDLATDFAKTLDMAPGGTVLWWHRNEPHDPWSVNVLMPDGRGFFPDFIIGVNGRKTEQNVLLADPKFNFERESEAEKVLARHNTYGHVMILTRGAANKWMIASWDEKRAKPVATTEFRFADMAGF